MANFQATLFRTFKDKTPWNDPPCTENPLNVSAIVSHEIFIKAFLMRWFKWSFEILDKIPNGEMIIMEYDEVKDHYELKSNLMKVPHEILTSEQQNLFDNPLNHNNTDSSSILKKSPYMYNTKSISFLHFIYLLIYIKYITL